MLSLHFSLSPCLHVSMLVLCVHVPEPVSICLPNLACDVRCRGFEIYLFLCVYMCVCGCVLVRVCVQLLASVCVCVMNRVLRSKCFSSDGLFCSVIKAIHDYRTKLMLFTQA